MTLKTWQLPLVALSACVLLSFTGCNKETPKAEEPKQKPVKTAEENVHDHSEWWCKEHGIPEAECLTCLRTEAELKKKGDWCDKHERAKSQCFICDASLKEKYAAKYRAKYGKEPPPIEDEKASKKEEKNQ